MLWGPYALRTEYTEWWHTQHRTRKTYLNQGLDTKIDLAGKMMTHTHSLNTQEKTYRDPCSM